MNQDQINQTEWSNPNNWTLLCYHSERDTRMFVPKRFGWGWTINFRHKNGLKVFFGLLAVPVVILIVVAITRSAH